VPLPSPNASLSRPPSSPSLSTLSISSGSRSARSTYSRLSAFSKSLTNGGSFGKSDAKRLSNSHKFGKYTESNEEDYEDVFGKLNSTGASLFQNFFFTLLPTRCLLFYAATKPPMQTLQLNTQLSNKSWVSSPPSFCHFFSSISMICSLEMNTRTKKIHLLRYVLLRDVLINVLGSDSVFADRRGVCRR
jgi:hypothetical protein